MTAADPSDGGGAATVAAARNTAIDTAHRPILGIVMMPVQRGETAPRFFPSTGSSSSTSSRAVHVGYTRVAVRRGRRTVICKLPSREGHCKRELLICLQSIDQSHVYRSYSMITENCTQLPGFLETFSRLQKWAAQIAACHPNWLRDLRPIYASFLDLNGRFVHDGDARGQNFRERARFVMDLDEMDALKSLKSAFIAPCALPTRFALSSTVRSIRPTRLRWNPRHRRARVICSAADDGIAAPPAVEEKEAPYETSEEIAPPPSTFFQAISQAQSAVTSALEAGEKLVEIEFPPLPSAMLESAAVGAYDVSDANIKLAVDFARRFANNGKRVVITFPDAVEKDRAVEQNNESEEPVDGIRFGLLKDTKRGSLLDQIWTTPEVDIAVREDDDIYIVLGASAQELPDVEQLVGKAGKRPVILFNLKLDSARGDLGLPAFPRKAMHYRFLSRVLPVYYLRTRTYSRSIRKAPFVVNYSGALYRVYPGPYQVLLDSASGNYRRLTTLNERPALGQVRDILTDGLNIDDVQGKKENFMFKGYKSTTWWEDDRDNQVSNKWRL